MLRSPLGRSHPTLKSSYYPITALSYTQGRGYDLRSGEGLEGVILKGLLKHPPDHVREEA